MFSFCVLSLSPGGQPELDDGSGDRRLRTHDADSQQPARTERRTDGRTQHGDRKVGGASRHSAEPDRLVGSLIWSNRKGTNEGNALFNDTINTFC